MAGISIAHLYNLRTSKTYSGQRHQYEKTKPVRSKIGERRKPNANGQPGFIRIGSVHQGDQDGVKGVYHINAVPEWNLDSADDPPQSCNRPVKIKLTEAQEKTPFGHDLTPSLETIATVIRQDDLLGFRYRFSLRAFDVVNGGQKSLPILLGSR